MIVYDGTKQDFLNSVDTDSIAEEIRDNILRNWDGIRRRMSLNRGSTPCNICTIP